ncbi:MAG: sensor histidine kinase, partial [Aggregatilineales bacterium]
PVDGEVTIHIFLKGSQIFTRVQDTGIGIESTELSCIFERFYRVDKSRARSSGGNGIGLTIAQHLVLAHDSIILVESSGLGCGSTFIFALPVDFVNIP